MLIKNRIRKTIKTTVFAFFSNQKSGHLCGSCTKPFIYFCVLCSIHELYSLHTHCINYNDNNKNDNNNNNYNNKVITTTITIKKNPKQSTVKTSTTVYSPATLSGHKNNMCA